MASALAREIGDRSASIANQLAAAQGILNVTQLSKSNQQTTPVIDLVLRGSSAVSKFA
jgi:hypothetical protein